MPTPDHHFSAAEYAKQRESGRNPETQEGRQTHALEQIADDLSAIRAILQAIASRMK